MLRITLEQWRMFRAVVEFGGFNQASQSIFKSQSSIHNAVSKIEESLGVKLFVIQGRKTVLTEAGTLILRRANFLLDEAAKVEAVGHTLGQGTESRLRIAIDEIFPQALLFKVLENVSIEYPLLQIELIETVLNGSTELLENTKVDIAISATPLSNGLSESLCHIDFVGVASPDHQLHKIDTELTLEDLKSHRQIVVRDSAVGTKKDEGWLGANQRWTVSHIKTSIDMICKGLGFAWLPASSIESHLKTQQLVPLRLGQNSKRSGQLYLVFKDADRLGPAAQYFLTELRTQCLSLKATH